jgi:hypothetical protein
MSGSVVKRFPRGREEVHDIPPSYVAHEHNRRKIAQSCLPDAQQAPCPHERTQISSFAQLHSHDVESGLSSQYLLSRLRANDLSVGYPSVGHPSNLRVRMIAPLQKKCVLHFIASA